MGNSALGRHPLGKPRPLAGILDIQLLAPRTIICWSTCEKRPVIWFVVFSNRTVAWEVLTGEEVLHPTFNTDEPVGWTQTSHRSLKYFAHLFKDTISLFKALIKKHIYYFFRTNKILCYLDYHVYYYMHLKRHEKMQTSVTEQKIN